MSAATAVDSQQVPVAIASIDNLTSSTDEKQLFSVSPSQSTSSHSAACVRTSTKSSLFSEKADDDSNNVYGEEEPEERAMMADIKACRRALDLFLDSKIAEAEDILKTHLCQTSMYYALAKSTMLCLKSMMTFQPSDMQEAIDTLKHTNHLANNIRKSGSKSVGWLSWVRGGRLTVEHLKKMKRIHLHAELVHAEAYMLKALLCVIHDENLISLLREGIHVRSAYQTFALLEKYVESVREDEALGKDVSAYALDKHFVSGVNFGMGTFQVMLSLLPGFALKVLEVIGMSGSREHGMRLIESTGGWDNYKKTGIAPARQGSDEALRRQFCDILLIGYHVLFAKLVPVSDADDDLGDRVLAYNLELYPKGVFFLCFRGRQLFSLTKLQEAKEKYIEAIATQKDWAQLQHMCFWERGLIATLEHDWSTAAEMFDTLFQESNWSKAVYTYFRAVTLYMMAQQEINDEKKERLMTQVVFMMKRVPNSLQKIAGKSIPLEKFVSRKARKFIQQGNRLLLPDLEIAQAFGACDYIPLHLLKDNLGRINRELTTLNRSNETYPDDLCLAHHLRAMMARLLLIKIDTDKDQLRSIHRESMEIVFSNAKDVVYDHYVYYHARYENARMLILDNRLDEAAQEIHVITTAHEKGKYNVGAGHRAKSKYSLESTLLFKCHNCQSEIEMLKKEQKNDSRSSISSTSSDYRSL